MVSPSHSCSILFLDFWRDSSICLFVFFYGQSRIGSNDENTLSPISMNAYYTRRRNIPFFPSRLGYRVRDSVTEILWSELICNKHFFFISGIYLFYNLFLLVGAHSSKWLLIFLWEHDTVLSLSKLTV